MTLHRTVMLAAVLGACTTEKIQYVTRPPFNPGKDTANGFLGYFTVSEKQPNCGNGRAGRQASGKPTNPARAWADLQGSGHAASYCNGCHTVSERGNHV